VAYFFHHPVYDKQACIIDGSGLYDRKTMRSNEVTKRFGNKSIPTPTA